MILKGGGVCYLPGDDKSQYKDHMIDLYIPDTAVYYKYFLKEVFDCILIDKSVRTGQIPENLYSYIVNDETNRKYEQFDPHEILNGFKKWSDLKLADGQRNEAHPLETKHNSSDSSDGILSLVCEIANVVKPKKQTEITIMEDR